MRGDRYQAQRRGDEWAVIDLETGHDVALGHTSYAVGVAARMNDKWLDRLHGYLEDLEARRLNREELLRLMEEHDRAMLERLP